MEETGVPGRNHRSAARKWCRMEDRGEGVVEEEEEAVEEEEEDRAGGGGGSIDTFL